MIEFIKKSGHKDIILFVHGFTGGKETWKHPTAGYFYDQLIDIQYVRDNFDVAQFEYYTKLLDLFPAINSARQKITSLFKSVLPKSEKNISIEEISSLLRSRIRFDLSEYQNIIVIAHSMGGLVTKSCILRDLAEGRINKIRLFVSLAVPHLGADLATYGRLLSNNRQIADLAPLGELCPQLNDEWVKQPVRPEVKYFRGAYDSIVSKNSAVATDSIAQDIIDCDENHESICKPALGGLVIAATIKFLKDFKSNNTPFEVKKITDPNQYRDEIFVLKLMLADVHDASIRHSKEFFLNAEYVRKLLSSAADQEKLKDLYGRIRTLYQYSYEAHVGKGEKTSTTLVADIHGRILQEDAAFLKVAFPMLQALHKMGMLHQLANDLGNDIWWSEERSHAALKKIRKNAGSIGSAETT